MPLYTYQCPECSHTFEALHSLSAPKPPCPQCGSMSVTKYFGSLPARPLAPPPPPPPTFTRWAGDGAFLAAGILLPDKALRIDTIRDFEQALGACNAACPSARLTLFAAEPAQDAEHATKDTDGAFRTSLILGTVTASAHMDRLARIDPRHSIGAVEHLRQQDKAFALLRAHNATTQALAATLQPEHVQLWAGYNDSACCFFDLFYGSIYPKQSELEEHEKQWRRDLPEQVAAQLIEDFCGEHWDDQRALVGKRLASTRFDRGQSTARNEPRLVNLTLETLHTLERDVGKYLRDPAMYLNDLTFYWH